jgi:ubiquinone/menaquinone biosynthesis C-methylase UbiE
MRRKAQPLVDESDLDVEFIDLPGEEIPLEANSVDTVLITYTLCTIPDAVSALEGMRRVLKPGGSLIYCEHGTAPDANVRRWQNRLNPAWSRFSGGCNMNRDIPDLITSSGFDLRSDERMYIPGAKMLSYNFWGTATPKS